MSQAEIMEVLHHAAHEFLMWVGFGTLVGLAAKAIMPGRDPGGAIATLMMGIGGAVVGCGAVMFFVDGARVSPISAVGFASATGGAFILLFFYRVLSGAFFAESEDGERFIARKHRRNRRRTLVRGS